jgi:sensor histidine kinase YesM
VLAVSTRREVLLAEEIEMAKNYVAIQQVRFSESLQVHWKIAESVLYCTVPTLLLQPLIENAVVHAVEHNGAGTITVQADKRGSRLVVDVTDTGPGAPTDEPSTPAKSTGIGHANTRERLAALYGEDHVFQFSFEPGAGARVHIEIPFRPAAA